MYNFFSNNLKRKAFIKALKEIESQGFYVDLATDKDAVAILPDLSKAVANLSKKQDKPEKENPTMDLNQVEKDVESSRVKSNVNNLESSQYTSQNKSQFYQNLFSSSHSFLDSDEDYENLETLEQNSDSQDSLLREPRRNTNRDIFAKLNQKALMQESQKNELLQKQILEAHSKKVEFVKEPKQEEPKKLIVEVVANTKPKAKTVKKKKSLTNKKRKRKYDADIAGGFNF